VLTAASVPRLARGMRLREDTARGRWVVMAPERMFIPDETALEVLRLVDGTRSLEAIAEILATRFTAPREEILADILAMLHELAGKGVIVS
jgi:pyrroloquinoline quinone biosynthesis protein D